MNAAEKLIQIAEQEVGYLVHRFANNRTNHLPVFPIAQIKKPQRSTTTPAFFDLHTRKNILRDWSSYLSNDVLEKKSNKDLDSKTANAGSNNYTKYGAYFGHNGPDAYWCDYFVDWCFVQAFGRIKAQQLLCGGFSGYTPTSAQYYKNKGQYHKSNPLFGDQIFFKNTIRICHTGIVEKVTSTKVYTIEGNTSAGASVIPNGGAVCRKEYLLTAGGIDGYGRPDWSLVDQPKYTVGWYLDGNGWWYADSGDTYLKSCWQTINGHRYYFNAEGYAVKGWQEIDGKWYYFEPRTGHPLECALYVSDAGGIQDVGVF